MDEYYLKQNKELLANCNQDLLMQKLLQIGVLLNKANSIFSELGNVEQEFCLQFHIDGASLNHCLRWGQQACQDLIDFPDQVHVDYPKDK